VSIYSGNGLGEAYHSFAPGFPPLQQNWRHFVIELSPRKLRIQIDDFVAFDRVDYGAPYPTFPAPVTLDLGSVNYTDGPFTVVVDNLVVTVP
jgi:hypothetical protein